ncbi:MAG TPA: hypothetical protein P5127_06525, partial [Oscillospiraceae bacterium]|nr:hypothetical protein [Oscillospiraceae bacterium]
MLFDLVADLVGILITYTFMGEESTHFSFEIIPKIKQTMQEKEIFRKNVFFMANFIVKMCFLRLKKAEKCVFLSSICLFFDIFVAAS